MVLWLTRKSPRAPKATVGSVARGAYPDVAERRQPRKKPVIGRGVKVARRSTHSRLYGRCVAAVHRPVILGARPSRLPVIPRAWRCVGAHHVVEGCSRLSSSSLRPGERVVVMGCPVVHFEIAGTDGAALRGYYAELVDWRIDAANTMSYDVISREENLNAGGVGIGGEFPKSQRAFRATVTFCVEVLDVETSLRRPGSLAGPRMMGPRAGQDSPRRPEAASC